jgi:hypothetical protein
MEDETLPALPDPRMEPTVSVERAGQVIGVSRGSAYEGVRRGQIPAIRIGHRLLVPTAALLRLVGVRIDSATVIDWSDAPSDGRQTRELTNVPQPKTEAVHDQDASRRGRR